jgi:hypothetical protein
MCSAFGGLWASRESIPQGLKPLSSAVAERAKPKGLAYLEAVRALPKFSISQNRDVGHLTRDRHHNSSIILEALGGPVSLSICAYLESNPGEALAGFAFVALCLFTVAGGSLVLLGCMLTIKWRGHATDPDRKNVLVSVAIAFFAIAAMANLLLLREIQHDGDHSALIWSSFGASLVAIAFAYLGRGPARKTVIGGGIALSLTWSPFIYILLTGPK